jgi:hypothetical protein
MKFLFLLGLLALLFVAAAEIASVSGREPTANNRPAKNQSPVAAYDYAPEWTGDSNISLIYVKSDCEVCFNLSAQVPNFEANDIHVYSYREVDYRDAKDIIEQYGITVVPSLVIEGEIHGFPSALGEETKFNGELVVPAPLPNLNLSTGEVQGVVSVTYLKDLSCDYCSDPYSYRLNLKFSGVYIEQEKNLSIDSAEGRELIKKYGIEIVPTAIITGLKPYSRLTDNWDYYGTVEEDGAYVLRELEAMHVNYTHV